MTAVRDERLRITDEEGAVAIFTTDPETLEGADAVAVLAVLDDAQTGGVYLTKRNVKNILAYLQGALDDAS